MGKVCGRLCPLIAVNDQVAPDTRYQASATPVYLAVSGVVLILGLDSLKRQVRRGITPLIVV